MITNAKIAGVGVNPEGYHKQPAGRGSKEFVVSSSSLRLFYDCPAKWVRPIKGFDGSTSFYEIPASKSLADGNLFDTLLLTPELFYERYAQHTENYPVTWLECPKCASASDALYCRKCGCERSKVHTVKAWDRRAAFCREWEANQRNSGLEIVSPEQIHDIRQAIESFRAREQFRILLDESQKQVHVTAEWHDEDTGVIVPVQCLIDVVPKVGSLFEKSLADVKRTKNARPLPWERWAHQVGYEIQAAWNTDLFVAATRREIVTFRFLLSESHAPFETGHRYMEQDLLDPSQDTGDIAEGRRQYRKMMAAYCRCIASGKWPGYDDHDEAVNGATRIAPNPYTVNARQFAPQYEFGSDEPEEAPAMAEDIIL